MSEETGTQNKYKSTMDAREAAWHPQTRLETVLSECTPGTVIHNSFEDEHYVAFRRNGCTYAVRLDTLPEFASTALPADKADRKESLSRQILTTSNINL